jgi:hypothetical protein
MMITWVFAAVLAEVSGGTIHQTNQTNPIHQAKQASNQTLLVSLSGTSMTCTKEGDHLVCIVPLDNEAVSQPEALPSAPPKATAPKLRTPTLVLPGPEVFAQLKAAEANIELAKSLLPKATTPEEAVLAQQLLYHARDQYRTTRALLHTVEGDLNSAPDPFDGDKQDTVAICEDRSLLPDECESAAP